MIKRLAKLLFQLILIILCLVVIIYFVIDLTKQKQIDQNSINGLNKSTEDLNAKYKVYFCPEDDCNLIIFNLLNNAKTIDCAVYDITINSIFDLIKDKTTRIITDNDQLTSEGKQYDFVKTDSSNNYMHNKFCVLDSNLLLIGSTNFTIDALTKQNNNFITTNNSDLINYAKQYFNELWNGNFTNGFDSIIFCASPSNCMQHYINETKNTNKSIKCMFFSFTYDNLKTELIEKQKQGIDIKIILEKSQDSQYSQYSLLKENNIKVIWDKNPSYMHNKFCIFDSNTIITGSMNSSNNGNFNNNESIIIINNSEVSKQYENYFNKYFSMWG